MACFAREGHRREKSRVEGCLPSPANHKDIQRGKIPYFQKRMSRRKSKFFKFNHIYDILTFFGFYFFVFQKYSVVAFNDDDDDKRIMEASYRQKQDDLPGLQYMACKVRESHVTYQRLVTCRCHGAFSMVEVDIEADD